MRKKRALPLLLICVACLVPADGASLVAADSIEKQISTFAQTIVVHQMPRVYEDLEKWNRTTEVFDGVRVQSRGLIPRISKRKKRVNHGTWKRYRVSVADPQSDVKVEVRNLSREGNIVRFQISALAAMRGDAELQQWTLGTRLFEVTAVANITVQAVFDCQVEIRAKGGLLLTGLSLAPSVVSSKLYLHAFDLVRVGKARGKLIGELGEELRGHIRRELTKREAKLTEKANKAIAKNLADGTLKISAADYLRAQLKELKPASKPSGEAGNK